MDPTLSNSMKTLTLTPAPDRVGCRLDTYVAAETELSRSAVARLADEGGVTVNKKSVKKNYLLRAGDVVCISLPDPVPDEARPQSIPLDIIFEDGDIIVINKPSGMVVHPAAGNRDGTLVNALLYHCGNSLSGIGGVTRPGIVHRIDKDTAGLLVVAKNDAAHAGLSAQLKGHHMSRVYYAILTGNPREDSGTVDAPLGRDPKNRKRMAVIRDPSIRSRDAVTHWTVLERYAGFCFVRCELETGRTHQIRVHMASIGHPLVGDVTYGGGRTRFEAAHAGLIHGQCLFAGELRLTHPVTGAQMCFRAPLPADFEALLEILRKREQI